MNLSTYPFIQKKREWGGGLNIKSAFHLPVNAQNIKHFCKRLPKTGVVDTPLFGQLRKMWGQINKPEQAENDSSDAISKVNSKAGWRPEEETQHSSGRGRCAGGLQTRYGSGSVDFCRQKQPACVFSLKCSWVIIVILTNKRGFVRPFRLFTTLSMVYLLSRRQTADKTLHKGFQLIQQE